MSDRTRIAWGSTLIVNMERGAAAGLIIAVLQYAGGPATFSMVVLTWLGWIVIGPVLALCLYGVGKVMASFGEVGAGVGGFIALIGTLLIGIGDPGLWLISKIDPLLVPIEGFKIFNRSAVLVAYQPPNG